MVFKSRAESRVFADDFARTLQGGDVVLLSGDLGSGKTFLCRQIIQHFCGTLTNVASPTFNLVQTYQAPLFTIYHFDLYRLKVPEEIYELGMEEALQNNLCLIEWPEIIINFVLPEKIIKLQLAIINKNSRSCTVNRS